MRCATGERTDIRFLHPDEGFIDVEHPVPIYVAADGPLALKTAGAYGDGRVCSHNQTQGTPAEEPRGDARGRRRRRPRLCPRTSTPRRSAMPACCSPARA